MGSFQGCVGTSPVPGVERMAPCQDPRASAGRLDVGGVEVRVDLDEARDVVCDHLAQDGLAGGKQARLLRDTVHRGAAFILI